MTQTPGFFDSVLHREDDEPMPHPDDETTVLTPVDPDSPDEPDPHEWLVSGDGIEDTNPDDEERHDAEQPILSAVYLENAAILQEASRLMRMIKLDTGIAYSIEDVLKVADWLKREQA